MSPAIYLAAVLMFYRADGQTPPRMLQPRDPIPHWHDRSYDAPRGYFWNRTPDGRNEFDRWMTDAEQKAIDEGRPLP